MIKISVKPLSANAAFKGKRYKTSEYKVYEKLLLWTLPKCTIPSGKLEITAKVGYSNPRADLDNFFKQFADILCKKYNFDDSRFYKINLTKDIVKIGDEYIEFEIKKLKD